MTQMNKITNWMAFLGGFLFAIGLGISGMMDPGKVLGFLNVFGPWDPSLAMVMGGAVLTNLFTFRWILKAKKPQMGETFHLPPSQKVDRKLILGALIFGVGWGLSGVCPGPGVANLGTLNTGALLFVSTMLAGMFLHHFLFSGNRGMAAKKNGPPPGN